MQILARGYSGWRAWWSCAFLASMEIEHLSGICSCCLMPHLLLPDRFGWAVARKRLTRCLRIPFQPAKDQERLASTNTLTGMIGARTKGLSAEHLGTGNYAPALISLPLLVTAAGYDENFRKPCLFIGGYGCIVSLSWHLYGDSLSGTKGAILVILTSFPHHRRVPNAPTFTHCNRMLWNDA